MIPLKLLHAPLLLAQWLKREGLYGEKIGVLATTGSVQYGLYTRWLSGFQVIYPEKENQTMLMEAIYGVKAGIISDAAAGSLGRLVKDFVRNDCLAIVLGCTELLMLIKSGDGMGAKLVNTLNILAEQLVHCCRAGLPLE